MAKKKKKRGHNYSFRGQVSSEWKVIIFLINRLINLNSVS